MGCRWQGFGVHSLRPALAGVAPVVPGWTPALEQRSGCHPAEAGGFGSSTSSKAGGRTAAITSSIGTLAGAALGLSAAVGRRRCGGWARIRSRMRSGDITVAEHVNPVATFKTSMGNFKAEIFLDQMPITASNFIDLCKTGFYDGIHFHKVIPEFGIQFGCPRAKDPQSTKVGKGKPDDGTSFELLDGSGKTIVRRGGKIPDELEAKLGNMKGTLSMGINGMPNSCGSQFFLNVNDNRFMDWFDYTTNPQMLVFGQVREGWRVVKRISEAQTLPCDDRPKEPIKMHSITIEGV